MNHPRNFLRQHAPAASLLALALALAVLGALAYVLLRGAIRADTQEELAAIANLKADQVENWLKDNRAKVEALAMGPQFAGLLQNYLGAGSPRAGQARQELTARNDFQLKVYGLSSILLLDAEGRVLMSSGDPDPPDDTARILAESRTPGVHLYDFAWERGAATGQPRVELGFFCRAVTGSATPPVVLYARIDPHRLLFPLIQTWPNASQTAETLLVRREGGEVVFLNALRHLPDSALKLRRPLDDPRLPAAAAVLGKAGVMEGGDYRGVPVLAYVRAIAGSPWGMVSKMDRREAYVVIDRLTWAAVGLGAVLLMGLTLSFRLWWRSEQAREAAERRALASHFDYLSKYANDGIVLADAERRIVEVNDRMTELYGYPREDLLGMHVDELRAEDERSKLAGQWQALHEAGSQIVETLHQRRDGSTFPVECSLRLIEHEGARFTQAIVRDISERRLAQQRIERLSRLYLLLYRANECIVRTRQSGQLFPEICRLIQRDGGFGLVWVGLKDDATGVVKPVAHAAASSFSMELVLEAKAQAVQGPAAVALGQGRPYVCNDTANDFGTSQWRQRTACAEAGSWAAFPLECQGSPCGVLSVCTRQTGAFDYDMANVLAEVGASLSSALDRFSLEKQREETLAELRENEQRLRLSAQVFEQSNEGILITDRDNRVISVNPAFTRATGYSAEEMRGRNPGLLKSGRHDRAFYQALWESIRVNGAWHGEIWNRRKDGHIYPEWLSISTIRGPDGAIQNHIAIFTDITELKRSEERIRHLAYYDALTRLPNRVFFQERLASALAQAERHRQPMAVCVLDLDHFKQINDSLGHLVGDSLLQEAARRMSGSVREQDTVARPGGDEFMLILPDTDADGAAHMAEKLVRRLAEPVCVDGYELHISCSLGLSLYPANGRDAASLIQSADAAMYRAKQHGRNNYQFFTEAMHAEAVRMLTLEQHLRQAPGRGELMLHYQPQVDLQSGQPIGCEALLRWRHPEWGMVATDSFIGVAEESGLIVDLGLWVLRQAASQIKAWDAAGHAPLPVSVNLSAAQFHRDHREGPLGEQVAMVLEESGIAPERLELEITETGLMQDAERTIETLNHLRGMGVRLAIDDFGTGYSSLNYLKRFPIHRLKIDQSFVRDLADSPEDEAIIDTIIGLGRNFGVKVIAEGVENERQLQKLRDKGCQEAQGFYFSRPLTAEGMAGWLRNGGGI